MEENSNLQETLQAVDDRIAELQEQVAMGEALDRLHENEDFVKVIVAGYLEAEAKRLFEVLTIPSAIKRDGMENMMDKLKSIRNFKAYVGECYKNAMMAPEQIEQEKQYRAQVTAMGANGDEDIIDAEVE